ncbi:MAG TPA: hypothetical protein RMH99_07945 [Sandaracinaceae bacterium LLY-WYZ-13_1]|nr:hypothetical protein [Sandaracinaceae bacterium LLY-WYZ-13_1]
MRTLSDRDPLAAAEAIASARRTPNAFDGSAAQLDAVTAEVSARLRRRGHVEDALALVRAAGETRSRALRLEEALACFQLGHDADVRRLAEANDDLAPVLRPLRAAFEGTSPGRAPRGSTDATRALFAAARAVSASRRGDTKAARRALANTIPVDHRQRLRAAIRFVAGDAHRADLRALHDAPPSSTARRLAGLVYARQHPREVLRLPGDDADLRAARHHALDALGEELSTTERAQLALARVGPEALSSPGDAYLWLAFERLEATDIDPDDAAEHAHALFSRALELDADEGEALRGRWLASRQRVRSTFPPEPRAVRALLEDGDRYLRWLSRERSLAAVAQSVAADLIRTKAVFDSPRRALRALKELRASARDPWVTTPGTLATLDQTEADVYSALGDRGRARAAVERAVERDPEDADSWDLLLELAEQHGDEEEVAHLARAAREATGDDSFAARIPVAGMDPSEARTPGALARLLADDPDTLDALEPSRDALELEDRLAFDIAALHILEPDGVDRYAAARLDAYASIEHRVALLVTALHRGRVGPVRAHFDRCETPQDALALTDVVVYAHHAIDPAFADVLTGRLAPWLGRAQLRDLTRRRGRGGEASALFEGSYEAAHDRLHPEMCLGTYAFEPQDDSTGSLPAAPVDETVAFALEQMQLDSAIVGLLPRHRKEAFVEWLLSTSRTGLPEPEEFSAALLKLLGAGLDEQLLPPVRRGPGPKTKRGRKKKRKKRKKKRR